tara:strand:+ start:190 stop:339 length:150 start_codon:yes stop_codon:yes gene_type:complete
LQNAKREEELSKSQQKAEFEEMDCKQDNDGTLNLDGDIIELKEEKLQFA